MTPLALSRKIRTLAARFPAAAEAAMRDGAQRLKGDLVQSAIASSTPHPPVDMAQYKAGFRSADVPGGAHVFNITKQAEWIERGRGKGKVPLAPIIEWVRRHPTMWKSGVATQRAAIRRGLRASKTKGIPVTVDAKHVSGLAKDRAIVEVAQAVARSIAAKGYAPRWVVRRALDELETMLPGLLTRRLNAAARSA